MQRLISNIALGALIVAAASLGASERDSQTTPRAVDLVIALDVSGSMSGLIDSAKQRLWDVINELARAQPQPDLRVAILTYGSPAYGQHTGYVRIDQALTRDLDAVNQRLFSFTTNGGEEYVARVVNRAVEGLQWSSEPDAMRLMFVAGNESAEQDPQLALQDVVASAARAGVIVSAIFCGPDNHANAASWRRIAEAGLGTYASIDQRADAVARIETPMDAKIAALNEALNATYIAYGDKGERAKARQHAQDDNASQMSLSAAASRVITKAGALYNSVEWDLIDAFESGKEVDAEDLPAVMKPMNEQEREDYVARQSERRRALSEEIGALASERREYIAEHRTSDQDNGLDAALVGGVKKLAEAHGFVFE
ncbi:MAG: VWA domain-containing protein [Gammaproteobacteria bacterium]|nr:VWA domain-containing protein [Gammaproteobacteria bacterium]